MQRASFSLGLVAVFFMLAVIGYTWQLKGSGGGIHGHVVMLVNFDSPGVRARTIELPGARVTARNVRFPFLSPAVITNAHGYFQLPQLASGTYQVCAELSGFAFGCLTTNVVVSNFNVVLSSPIQLQPKGAVIAGQVLLSDKPGTPCFVDRPAFRTFVTAKVILEDANRKVVSGPVQGNGIGQYVLPAGNLPQGKYTVVATCEGATGRAFVSSTLLPVDVFIRNSPPSLLRVETTIAGKAVRVVPMGSTVDLKAFAFDPDGNLLRFRWVDANGTSIPAGPAGTARFTVPPRPSSTTVFVEASDAQGGYAYSSIPVTGALPEPALFTGTVVNAETSAPISGANVTINGKALVTDAQGHFTARIANDVRFTISVRKPGFALTSKVAYSPAAGLRIPLQPVLGQPFNAAEGGRITSRGSERNKGLSLTVILPPKSLVDGKGNPFTGNGFAYLWGYPPGTPMPGDMSGVFGGRPGRLETFGAVDVVLTDTGGQKLQVRTGASLGLIIRTASPNPPATVPLFLFDEARGLWGEHGTLKLAGGEYNGIIRHMSSFNADLAFTTTGCIEYHVDPENSPALPFYLHIEQNGQTANHEPFQVNDVSGVVARLRPATNTDWWALPTATSPKTDAIGHGTLLSSNFTSNPADPNGDFPGVGATDSSGNPFCTVFTVAAQFPNHETYLTGLPGPTAATDELNYRNAVDTWAGGGRGTLGGFKAQNGFPAADEATAVYFNNADLKLGRDMHCRRVSPTRIACYVSNYLNNAQPPASPAIALIKAGDAHRLGGTDLLFATVAMEWDGSQPVDKQVQFYVYDAAGNRVDRASLDSEGPKSVPQICMACHGGSYNPADPLARHSRFLPFDVASFRMADDEFSAASLPGLGLDAFTRANQLRQFRALNALVADTERGRGLAHNASTELIDGWYASCGGVNNAACNACLGPNCANSFVNDFRPGPWAAEVQMYDRVVRPYCRGCHIMQPSIDWTDPAQMTGGLKPLIESRVCTGSGFPGNQRRMPHAEVPFKGFWQSPLAPLQMKAAPLSLPSCER